MGMTHIVHRLGDIQLRVYTWLILHYEWVGVCHRLYSVNTFAAKILIKKKQQQQNKSEMVFASFSPLRSS